MKDFDEKAKLILVIKDFGQRDIGIKCAAFGQTIESLKTFKDFVARAAECIES